ncbi:MAG: signal peptidase I, partial [Chloroflexota bacterium]
MHLKKYFTWLAIAVFVLLCILFAPQQIGGKAASVIVDGNSMEPLYHLGDLVIVRSKPSYQIGDIITYLHPDIGYVIHRIIAIQDGRFLLQGDHNTWVDSYLPTPEEVIGKAWIHLPKIGSMIGKLRSPWSLAFAAGLGSWLSFNIFLDTKKNHKNSSKTNNRKRKPRTTMRTLNIIEEPKMIVIAILFVLATMLTGWSQALPEDQIMVTEIPYSHHGKFSYYEPVPHAAEVYQEKIVDTGKPIFLKLATNLNVRFDYTINSQSPLVLAGTTRLVLELSASDGWKQVFVLQPDTPFSGPFASIEARIDLATIKAVLDNLQNLTGVFRSPYSFTLLPTVTFNGFVDGQDFTDEFSPRLEFLIDTNEIQLVQTGVNDLNSIEPVQEKTLTHTNRVPNTLSFLGLNLSVITLRWMAIIFVLLSLLALIYLYVFGKSPQLSGVSRIQKKYGSTIINISGVELPELSTPMVEVQTFD